MARRSLPAQEPGKGNGPRTPPDREGRPDVGGRASDGSGERSGPKSCGMPEGRRRMCRLATLGGATAKQGYERAAAQEGPTKRPPDDRDASAPNGRADEWRGRARGPRPRRGEEVRGSQGRRGGQSERQGAASTAGRGHARREPEGSQGPLDDRAASSPTRPRPRVHPRRRARARRIAFI